MRNKICSSVRERKVDRARLGNVWEGILITDGQNSPLTFIFVVG